MLITSMHINQARKKAQETLEIKTNKTLNLGSRKAETDEEYVFRIEYTTGSKTFGIGEITVNKKTGKTNHTSQHLLDRNIRRAEDGSAIC